MFYRDMCFLFLFFTVLFATAACGKKEEESEGRKEILAEEAYEICGKEEMPDELLEMIEEKKEAKFYLVYENGDWQYLAVGAGRTEGENYVIAVKDIYEIENRIFVETILTGKKYVREKKTGEPSACPYVVLRCEKNGKQVFFLP